MSSNWRENHRVLVTEAHTIGSLAVIRSLGRAGYRVIASSPVAEAIGFYSNYCHVPCVQPPYNEQQAFFDWLDDLVEREKITLIIPSEAFLLSVRPVFAKWQSLLAIPDSADVVYSAFSKFDLFQSCAEGGLQDHLPPFVLIKENDAPVQLNRLLSLNEPVFIKVDGVYSRTGNGSQVIKCTTLDNAIMKIAALRNDYTKVLVQGYVSGIGVGAFLARWKNKLLAEFMHRRIHEVPHTGGASSFRSAWRHEAIMLDAQARAAHLGWNGVGMFEYRWNPATDQFYLMEFNSRFWGSLHLALFAGVDFPRLLADAFFMQPNPSVTDYALIRCRLTFPREVEYVFSCLKDSTLPWTRKLWAILEFVYLGLNPKVYTDLNFPKDRALYWRVMTRSIRRFFS
jgi:predicted ATP-grasp superfamily ATP-dependent carboligase